MTTTTDLGFELPWEVHEMDRWLTEGNPTWGWRGDPRLSLHMGIVTTTRAGIDHRTGRFQRKGDRIGWCWQVLRHNEDGTDTPILQAKGNELAEIIPRLLKMDPRTPGFEPVMDTVEREDAVVQKHKEDAMKDAYGEATEHMWRLVQEREHGRSTIRQVGGSDERADRNLVT